MKMNIYTVKDTKAGIHNGLYPAVNGAVMSRNLDYLINKAQEQNEFNTFTEDKALYLVGVWDTATNEFEAKSEFVSNLIDYKQTTTENKE